MIFEPALQERQPIASKLLAAALKRKALSNAYLFSGRSIADKWLLAQRLAAFLNCISKNTDDYFSCISRAETNGSQSQHDSYCQNCRWIADGEHPQAWMILEGQGESGKIPVEKARLLTEEMNKTSRYMRVVVIPQAEQSCLHEAPANALLKSIEEAQDNSLFLLFAASSEQVLPTIVSRSQVIPVQNAFKPGLWIEGESSSEEALKQNEKLISLKSEFIHGVRKRLSGSSSIHGSYLKAVSESQELSERFLSLCRDEGLEADILIDTLLAAELEVLRDVSSRNYGVSLYLSRLAELSEQSKSQLDHYVREGNVLETFAYSLTELRAKFLREFSLAKH